MAHFLRLMIFLTCQNLHHYLWVIQMARSRRMGSVMVSVHFEGGIQSEFHFLLAGACPEAAHMLIDILTLPCSKDLIMKAFRYYTLYAG